MNERSEGEFPHVPPEATKHSGKTRSTRGAHTATPLRRIGAAAAAEARRDGC